VCCVVLYGDGASIVDICWSVPVLGYQGPILEDDGVGDVAGVQALGLAVGECGLAGGCGV